ncbi:hypothetical protein GCM10010411_15320 [Actinomadura fulvescens]|uniref:Uncharacterized protein n=1 Tax=Actinomadura fulvescens TaxID=46160 RepID=A0ABN3PIJ3_9ACTN
MGLGGVIFGYVVVAVGVVPFGWLEVRRTESLVDPRLFRRPPFAAVVGAIVVFVAFSATLVLNTLYLQHARGMTPLDVGLVIAMFAPAAGRQRQPPAGERKRCGWAGVRTANLGCGG